MNDAVAKTPSVNDQIATFKGYTTNNGEVIAAQETRPLGGSVDNDANPDGGEDPTNLVNQEGQNNQGEGEANQQRQAPQQRRPNRLTADERIGQATARQRAAERRADLAEGRNQALEARLASIEGRLNGAGQNGGLTNGQAQTIDPNAPDPSRYQYGELDSRYVADVARYTAQKTIDADNERRNQQSRQAQANEAKVRVDAFLDGGSQKFEDFRDVVFDSRDSWSLSPTVGELAFGSPVGHEILYDLAQNPEESHRVFRMSPALQAAWFGRQEAKYDSGESPPANRGRPPRQAQQPNGQAPVRSTQAPPPPTRIRNGSGNSTQPASSSTTDFASFEAMAMAPLRRQ